MFERYLCEAQGLRRLDGVPGRAETIARYAELGGAPVPDIDYYELLAAVVMTLITSRLADVLVETGRVTPDIAAIYPTRAVGLVSRLPSPRIPPLTAPRAPAPRAPGVLDCAIEQRSVVDCAIDMLLAAAGGG